MFGVLNSSIILHTIFPCMLPLCSLTQPTTTTRKTTRRRTTTTTTTTTCLQKCGKYVSFHTPNGLLLPHACDATVNKQTCFLARHRVHEATVDSAVQDIGATCLLWVCLHMWMLVIQYPVRLRIHLLAQCADGTHPQSFFHRLPNDFQKKISWEKVKPNSSEPSLRNPLLHLRPRPNNPKQKGTYTWNQNQLVKTRKWTDMN
jgi:hypothetical protein